ncbi:uncharacterized protein LOC136758487 [Amia ocellicauda]|uniref:uncharacterized protein LOC136758487 n=1 Tax=Amia ocellicauda TaxID=2972642 RepID=UPI003464018E
MTTFLKCCLLAQGFQCRLQERSHSRRSLQTRGLFHRAGQVRSGCWGADTPRGEPIQLLTHSLSESQENVRGDACQPLDIHVTDSTAPKEEDDDDTRSGTLHFYLPSPQCEEQEEEEEKRDTRPQNVNIGPFEALEVSPVLKPSTDRREENKKEIKRNASARPLSAVLQPRTQISSVTPTLKRKQMPIRQNLPAATSVVWLGSSDNISTDPEEKDLRGKDPWCTNSVNIPPLKTAQPNSPGGKGSSHRSVVHKHNYNYYERAVLTPGIHNIKLKTTKTLEFGHRGPREIKTVYVLQASSRRPKSACYPNSVSSLAKRYHTPSLSF